MSAISPPRHQRRYPWTARLLHRLAFNAIVAQKGLADLEGRLYAVRLAAIEVDRPIFVASLPRAGTTVMLEAISALEGFASHTYRDMPFLLVPMLWNALCAPLRRPDVQFARAHGDGMTIGHDSPEAFEEVLWRTFWPEHYTADRIIPWSPDERDAGDAFEPFIKAHIKKILALRAGAAGRYVSKNNVNIARSGKLARLFPDAVVLVMFRDPLAQAASLLRTHLTFERIHAGEPFSRRYMADIGHFDFGANLRPVDFNGWLTGARFGRGPGSARSVDFWLGYWCAAFEHVLASAGPNVALASYDACCARPAAALGRIAERAGIAPDALIAQAKRFRPTSSATAANPRVSPTLLARARGVHAELRDRAIV